jgi:hypothetical protein
LHENVIVPACGFLLMFGEIFANVSARLGRVLIL